MFLLKLSNIVKELFLIIFVTKWVFKKPKKANILIYDDESIENLEFFLKGKKFEIFHVRHEILNIYVLINSILKNGFYKVRENYKLTFFTIVDPKLVITLIDENPGFFKLKSLYRKPKYISIQIAFKDNNFYDYIDNFTKKNKNYKFESNYTFVLGKNDQKKYKKYINGKIICLGSIKNNNFVKKNKHTKKIKKILFISSLPINRNINFKVSRGYRIFSMLKEYCKKNKLKLLVLSKHDKNFEKKYREVYGGFDWKFIPKESVKKTYQTINKANFIVFDNSTLGYEVLTKNIKGVCFPKVFPYKNYSKKYSLNGPFWNCKLTQTNFENKISKIIRTPDYEWRKIIKRTVRNIIYYNPSNDLLKNKLTQLV